MNIVVVVASAFLLSTLAAHAQDLAAGENSFKKCLPCHAVGEGAKNKVGPLLNGLEGRKTGTIEGFSYSEANKNSGIIWSKDTFLDYIKDPRAKIPGTKMIFPGIKNEKEATDLWAYLASFDASGKKK
jgi:cytochrome c